MLARHAILAAALLAAWSGAAGAGPAVANFRDGQTVRYPLVLLAGTTGDPSAGEVTVTDESPSRAARSSSGLAGGGAFKALVELTPGENRLTVRCGGQAEAKLTLHYRPADSQYDVRVFYWTDSSGRTDYQTPDANDPQDWRGKLSTAALLMQCFTAERLHDVGLGRRTFDLELDESGRVKVRQLRGSGSADEYRAMTGRQLYAAAAEELARQYPRTTVTDLVIPAFTLYDANSSRALAHTALGGGRLALFGGGCLYTWPGRPGDAQAALMDERLVDPRRFHSDSNGRHVRWACASTTIGAALHELGHCFGLPHSTDALDIMTRGFDHFNRLFTLVEPPSARRAEALAFKPEEAARWAPVSAAALAASRFFEPDQREWKDDTRPTFRLDPEGGWVHVDATEGLRFVAVYRYSPNDGGQAVYNVALASKAIGVSVMWKDLAKLAPREQMKLVAIDAQGNAAQVALKDLLGEK